VGLDYLRVQGIVGPRALLEHEFIDLLGDVLDKLPSLVFLGLRLGLGLQLILSGETAAGDVELCHFKF
jgi:hypothetical protein